MCKSALVGIEMPRNSLLQRSELFQDYGCSSCHLLSFALIHPLLWLGLLLVLTAFSPAFSFEGNSIFNVYGTDFTDSDRKQPLFAPTIQAIQRAVFPKKVVVHSVKWYELDRAIADKKADLIIGGPSVYRRKIHAGLRDLSTAVTPECPNPNRSLGSVFFALRGDERISNLSDLRGKILGTNLRDTFRGELIPKKEILDKGFDPDHFFRKTLYLGNKPDERIKALEDGRVDVIVLDSCYAEELKANGGEDLFEKFKVINEKKNRFSRCVTSTQLYPNYSLLIPSTLDLDTIRRILKEVQDTKYPPGYGWMVAGDFTPVDDLYQSLKIGPFSHLNFITFSAAVHRYRYVIFCVVLFFLFLVLSSLHARRLVKKRTEMLVKAHERERSLRRKSSDIEACYRASAQKLKTAQICSAVAHDLAQPVSSMLLYLNELEKSLHESVDGNRDRQLMVLGKIRLRAEKIDDIIRSVRDFSGKGVELRHEDLYGIVSEAIEDFKTLYTVPDSEVLLDAEADCRIYCVADQLKLAFLNILKNSLRAVTQQKQKKILVSIRQRVSVVSIEFEDSGPTLSSCQIEAIRLNSKNKHALKHTPENMGIGLNIVEAIVCLNAGTISYSNNRFGGLLVRIEFPITTERQPNELGNTEQIRFCHQSPR